MKLIENPYITLEEYNCWMYSFLHKSFTPLILQHTVSIIKRADHHRRWQSWCAEVGGDRAPNKRARWTNLGGKNRVSSGRSPQKGSENRVAPDQWSSGELVTSEQRQSMVPDDHVASRALSLHVTWGRTGKALWSGLRNRFLEISFKTLTPGSFTGHPLLSGDTVRRTMLIST